MTIRIHARAGAYRYLTLGGGPVGAEAAKSATFDLNTGVVNPVGASITAKIEPLDNLWYACEVTLISGWEISIKLTSDAGQPASEEPLMWIHGVEIEQHAVQSWKDRVSGHDFEVGGGAWRWLPAAPELGGLPGVEELYGYTASLVAGEAADWSFLHDGSGGTLVLFQHQTASGTKYRNKVYTVTEDAGAGALLGASADASRWNYSVTNAAAQSLFSIDGGSLTGAKWLAASYGSASSPNAQLFEQGTLVASANAGSEPLAARATVPLALGGRLGPQQVVHEVIAYDRVLNDEEITQLKDYFSTWLPEYQLKCKKPTAAIAAVGLSTRY